jgi:hypothetical protein
MPGNQTRKSLARLEFLFTCLMAGAAVGPCLMRAWATEGSPAMKLTSPAFRDGLSIPSEYTCDGQNISPPLMWSDPPAGTRTLALICEDPDAHNGTWTHWVLYGLPAFVTELPAGVSTAEIPSVGGRQGANSFHHLGYGGPCPPAGEMHHYIFTIYAVDAFITLEANAGRADLLGALDGHIIGQGQLMGTYRKR